jgi:hypothetical protein
MNTAKPMIGDPIRVPYFPIAGTVVSVSSDGNVVAQFPAITVAHISDLVMYADENNSIGWKFPK